MSKERRVGEMEREREDGGEKGREREAGRERKVEREKGREREDEGVERGREGERSMCGVNGVG